MPTQVQFRRGNTAQTAVFTGALAELTVDTDQKTVIVHDGVTQGGTYLSTKQFTQSAFNTANGANGLAQSAYNQANTNASNITIIQGVNLTQNTNITAVNNFAQSAFNTANGANGLAAGAYNTANTKFNSTGGTISGDVSITGNLTVTGETFYANVTNLNVDDSFIILNANTVGSPTLDGGIEIDRGTGNNTFLYWNESDKAWEYIDHLLGVYTIASESFVATSITPVNQYTQASFDAANSANSLATSANNIAFGANGLAAGAFNKANTSIQNSGTQTLNGNLIVNGSVNTTQWSNTANAYVSNKLYAGIAPSLSTPLPDLIAQFTGNVASYVQVNAENIDPQGTADYVATADVGTDTTFYVNLGIENSQAGEGVFYPLDGYLIVQGNTGQVGGNLIIGTTSETPGQHTKIIAGGSEESNVVIQFNDDLSTLFYGNAIPSTTNTQYLGSSTKRWHSLYVGPGSVNIDNIVLSNNNGQLVITGASDFVISGSSVPSTGDISNKANNAYDRANAAFASSNAVNGYAVSAFALANTNAGAIAVIQGVNTGQNTTITAVNGFAAGAFAQANTNAGAIAVIQGVDLGQNNAIAVIQGVDLGQNSAISIIQGVDSGQNTRMSIIEGVDLGQNSAISIIQGVDLTQNTNITAVNGFAAGAFAQANTNAGAIAIIQGVNLTQNTNITAVNNFAQSAYNEANSAYSYTTQVEVLAGNAYNRANAAFASSNAVNGYAVSAFATANGANGLAAGAFAQANTNATAISIIQGVDTAQNTRMSIIEGVDLTQNTNITAVNGFAAGAFAQANTNAGAIAVIQGVDLGQNNAIAVIQGVDLTQNTNITNATTLAQDAYNNSNTKFSSSGGTITGSVTITNDLTVNGNVSFVGNVTSVTVSGNTGQFFGYTANGFNALYAGIPIGYNIEPQAVFTLSSDFDGYAAINMQNINSGANSSSDLFLIADNGSDVDGYLNLGLGSSNYNYEGYSLFGPNDGYLFVSGNTATGGGDLILGTQLGHDIIFAVNGLNTENEVMRIASSNTLIIKSGINSTSVDTGSLKVNGGIGVTGTLWASQVVSNNVNLYNLSTTIFAATNTATGIAQAAYNQANVTIGVDATQNTRISSVEGVDIAQNSAIAIIQGVDLTQNTNITAVNNFAASAYEQANTANTRAFNTVLKSGDTMTGSLTGVTTLGTTTVSLAQVDVTSNTFTTSSTSQVSIDAWPINTYRSAKYFVQITSGTHYHIIELNVVHDDSTVFLAQYGEIITNANLGSFDADISNGTVRVLFTGTNAVSTVKVLKTLIDI